MSIRILCVIPFLATALAQQEREPGKGANFYSIEKEAALGNQLAAEFRRAARMLESAAALAYVQGIGERLAAQIDGLPFACTFALFADDAAYSEITALPGGFLFVPSSLILAVKDGDELAGMLAHAMAHVASRDATRQATRGQMVNIASIPLVFSGGWTGYAVREGQGLAIPLGMLQMSRQRELAANVLAARTMAAAGYDPAALARYIERVQAPDGPQPGIWAALPQRSQRLEAIRTVIRELPAQVYAPRQDFETVREEVRRLAEAMPKR